MLKISTIMQQVRNFLLRIINKEFLIFLLFLVLSGAFWTMTTFNEVWEKEIKIPIQIVNVPQNVVLTSDEVDTVRVILRDKGFVLVNYLIGGNDYEKLAIKADFNTYNRGNGYGVVTAAEIQRLIYKQLASSTKIMQQQGKPEKSEFTYNYGQSKKIPVVYTGKVEPEELYFISNVTYSPDSVLVYASHKKLDSLECAYTKPIYITKAHDTLSVYTELRKMQGVKIMPNNVKVTFHTDILTETTINDIRIKGVNVPDGKIIRTFPSKVNVTFVSGAKTLKDIKASDFVVVVDYDDIIKHPSDKCTLHLVRQPHEVQKVRLSMKSVDYLIEEN